MLKFKQSLNGLVEAKDPDVVVSHQTKLINLFVEKQESFMAKPAAVKQEPSRNQQVVSVVSSISSTDQILQKESKSPTVRPIWFETSHKREIR